MLLQLKVNDGTRAGSLKDVIAKFQFNLTSLAGLGWLVKVNAHIFALWTSLETLFLLAMLDTQLDTQEL